MRRFFLVSLLMASSLALGQTATLQGDRGHPAHASRWVETKLYFGLSLQSAPADPILEQRWQQFLDSEVTPRFPAGLTVLDG